MIKRFFIIGLINFSFVFSIVQIGAYTNNSSTTRQETPAMTPTQTITSIATPTPIIRIIKRIIRVTVTPGPSTTTNDQVSQPTITNQPTQVPSAPTQTPQSNRCIIIIDGSQYDVTDFRNIHSGGDVFNCGSDMSAIFHNRHPSSFLTTMAKYKV